MAKTCTRRNAWSSVEDFLEGELSECEGESTDSEATLDADSGAGGSKCSRTREGGGASRAPITARAVTMRQRGWAHGSALKICPPRALGRESGREEERWEGRWVGC